VTCDRAIERRRRHKTAVELLGDKRFLEYVYAVLPAWGMQPGKNNRHLLVRWVEVMGNRHGVPSEAAWLDGLQLWARFALDAVTPERAAESAADLITWKAQNANIAIQKDLDVEFRSVEPLNAP
jgi:hypothetical protein